MYLNPMRVQRIVQLFAVKSREYVTLKHTSSRKSDTIIIIIIRLKNCRRAVCNYYFTRNHF